MKLSAKLVTIVGALALVVVALAGIVANIGASASDDGTVTLDQSWYGGDLAVGVPVKITVTDAAEDTTSTSTDSITFNGTASTTPQFKELTGPLADNDDDGDVDSDDFVVTDTVGGTLRGDDFLVMPVDIPGGGVNIVAKQSSTSIDSTDGAIALDISYKHDIVQSLTNAVTIESSSYATGITVTVTEETAASGGEFTATVTVVSATTTNAQLLVADGDTIKVTLTESEDTASSKVETTGPEILVTSPDDGDKTFEKRPTFVVEITDSQSLVDPDTIVFTIDGTDQTPEVSTSGGVTTASFKPSTDLDDGVPEAAIEWSVTAEDLAGNSTTSDSDDDTEGSQDHSVTIDRVGAKIASAVTGDWWDTSQTTTDKTNTSDDNAYVVAVTFDEPVQISSIEDDGSQFRVDDYQPVSAYAYSGAPTIVFLTMAAAFDPDDTPTVEVVESIFDTAGNTTPVDEDEATDGLAPVITVTLDDPLINDATDVEATLTITADEPLQGNLPTVTVTTPEGLSNPISISVTLTGTDAWKAIIDVGDDGLLDGDQAITVTGSDEADNVVTVGGTDPDDDDYPAALALEVDTAIASPTITPADASTDSNASPFVQVQYAEEVTLSAATFNGVDILAALLASSADNELFVLAPGSYPDGATELALGDHEIIVTASDLAGNEDEDASAEFEIEERDDFSLPLIAGWNLVSLPGQPSDPSINAVITDSDVGTVITYDPTVEGGWLTASRDTSTTSDVLLGSLSQIDAQHAYWINTTSFDPIEVAIPPIAAAALPPTVPVSAGWNLIPVIDTTGTVAAGANLPSNIAEYLAGVDVSRAYRYQSLTGSFAGLLLTGAPSAIEVGEGLWVFVNEAGTIVP